MHPTTRRQVGLKVAWSSVSITRKQWSRGRRESTVMRFAATRSNDSHTIIVDRRVSLPPTAVPRRANCVARHQLHVKAPLYSASASQDVLW